MDNVDFWVIFRYVEIIFKQLLLCSHCMPVIGEECVVYQFKGYIILFAPLALISYVKDHESYAFLCYIYNKSMKSFSD